MPRIAYKERTFSPATRLVIDQANAIITRMAQQGYTLSLRQLYYQFVAADLIPNRQTEYKRLGDIVSEGRLAGLIDWNAIEDRGRNLAGTYGYDSDPADHVASIATWFKLDRWAGQSYRPEVWVEKDALSGVVGRVANEFDVPYIACKGYMSQSEMWAAGRRLMRWRNAGYTPVVIHLGDHDPSGIDMSRDIEERLATFSEGYVAVRRIALNMDQIQQYDPPPNPAKLTDSRSTSYVAEYGDDSWELDALDPAVLGQLIRDELESFRDDDALASVKRREAEAVVEVKGVAAHWRLVVDHLDDQGLLPEPEEAEEDDDE